MICQYLPIWTEQAWSILDVAEYIACAGIYFTSASCLSLLFSRKSHNRYVYSGQRVKTIKKLHLTGTHIYCSVSIAVEQQPPPPQRVNIAMLHVVINKLNANVELGVVVDQSLSDNQLKTEEKVLESMNK